MSVGVSIKVLAGGKWQVSKVDGLAATAGLAVGDEIVAINGKPRQKWKRPKMRPGDRVSIIRDGKPLNVVLAKQQRSPSLKGWLKYITRASPDQGPALIKEIWAENLTGRLSDADAAEADAAMRRRLAAPPKLPLGESPRPASSVEPTAGWSGLYDKDREQWLRQIAANRDYPPLMHRLVELLTTYLHKKSSSKVYLCAWPSQDVLRRGLKCRAADVGDALRALETEGDIIVTPRRGRKTSIIAIRLKPNSADHEVTAPPQDDPPHISASAVEAPARAAYAPAEQATIPATLEIPAGSAVCVRASPIAIANGTRRRPEPPAPAETDLAAWDAARIADIERAEFIDNLVRNQARDRPPFSFEYNPFEE
jgi:hypothetical protein